MIPVFFTLSAIIALHGGAYLLGLPLWLNEILFLFLPALMGMKLFEGFKPDRWPQARILLLIVVLSAGATLAAGLLQAGLAHFFSEADPLKQGWIGTTNARTYLDPQSVLLLVLIPAVSEEFLFRGFLLDRLRFPKHASLLISALMFAGAHLNPAYMAALFLLGLFFGWIKLKWGLGAAVISHLTNNYLALVLVSFL